MKVDTNFDLIDLKKKEWSSDKKMNILNISIPGKPIPKKSVRNNWRNPQKDLMIQIRNIISNQLPETFTAIAQHVPVTVNFYYFFEPTATERTKKFLDLIKNEDYPYVKKPDKDNLEKFYKDCMSKLLYYDDNQTYAGCEAKFYTPNNARTEIELIW